MCDDRTGPSMWESGSWDVSGAGHTMQRGPGVGPGEEWPREGCVRLCRYPGRPQDPGGGCHRSVTGGSQSGIRVLLQLSGTIREECQFVLFALNIHTTKSFIEFCL